MKAIVHQVFLDNPDKKNVKKAIHKEVYDLFGAIPILVNMDVLIGNLQPRRDPYAVDRDIDGGDKSGYSPFQSIDLDFVPP